MRLTDEQIINMFLAEEASFAHGTPYDDCVIAFTRKCLALAAIPDEPKEYNDRERRGFEVSQPGGLPK